jgi:membrane protease YdiL (CAAX protease family)
MNTILERRPIAFTFAVTIALIGGAVAGRLVLAPLLPHLTLDGIGLLLNWLFVGVTIALVAWGGWWEKIHFTAPVDRRALVYLLPFAIAVFIPVVFGLAIPEVSLTQGNVLPDWATLLVVVVGVALGAALFEEILYRGVLLRALEPRGHLFAGVVTATAFGLTHVSKIILGGSVAEWLPSMMLIIPLGIGLAAVAFRLESIWPLVVWHFAVDVTGLLSASQSLPYTLTTLGFILFVGVMGLWLLWQDDRAAKAAQFGDTTSTVTESGELVSNSR